MIDASQVRKNKKLTITASSNGIEKAEKALIRLGFNSKTNFAKLQFIGRSTVTKFFQSKPIQLDSFKRICQALKLDWREIAGIADENRLKPLTRNDSSSSELVEGVEQGQAPRRKVTVIDKQNKKIKASIVLEGDINLVQNPKFIEWILQDYSGDSINIIDIKPGSIRLIVEGSPEDIERLRSRIESGELKELRGFPVQDIQILRETSEDDQNNEFDQKWRLVEEIATSGAVGRDLRGADLSDADLSGADLRGADLRGADLRGTDLKGVNLRGAKLKGAKLSGTNLIRANLIRGANLILDYLIGTDLIGVNLIAANLIHTNLIRGYLRGANLRGAKLSGTNLSGGYLSGANLSGANLRGANLSDGYLIRADLRGAKLSGAKLRGAKLSGAKLRDADLIRAYLSGADLRGADLIRADLRGADLRGADLRGAYLIRAYLIYTNLSDANLSGAVVKNARFGNNSGIDESLKRDLIQRGAIFEDLPGDRSKSLTPIKR
ncbi:pentapeptide repeat-containing protein [Moorena sp. SIO2C4]|uniref:pentapeptide repeat-containing protein n=1 Tax=Moorena sp. SIO2C4 TaxID=2607824 RepID=UPI0013CC3859|nr:pentapeptide repeat-containing protein [Moorena sp. SIO2C4]NES44087.1 pentapeptide repeat-containing protein [Moorena sp. SIO2C4]